MREQGAISVRTSVRVSFYSLVLSHEDRLFAFDPKQKIAAEYLVTNSRKISLVRNLDQSLLEEIFKIRGELEQEIRCQRLYKDWFLLSARTAEKSELFNFCLLSITQQKVIQLGAHPGELDERQRQVWFPGPESKTVRIMLRANIESILTLTEEQKKAYLKLNKTNDPHRIIFHQFTFD